jgi:putative hydrolase of the HAD superfamily
MQGLLEGELGIGAEAFEDAFARARDEVKARLGETASAHSRLLYAGRLLELLGMRSQPATALRLEAAYWRDFLLVCERFAGVEELLLETRLHNIPVCVVTDLTMAIQYRKLLHLGIAELVDWIVTSEETTGDKVTLGPYLLAKEKLGLADGAPVWMIGDNRPDTEAAREALGATTFLRLKGSNRHLAAGADASFESFRDLLAMITPILRGAD